MMIVMVPVSMELTQWEGKSSHDHIEMGNYNYVKYNKRDVHGDTANAVRDLAT